MTAPRTAPRDERGIQWTGRRLLDLARAAPGLAAIVVMAVVGIGVLAYLTTVHYAKVPLFCSTTGLINCAQVTSSAFSVVPGTSIPITIPGMLWFLVSGGIAVAALRGLWRGEPEPPRLRVAQLVWSALGLLVVLYLVFVELVRLHKICEWCSVAHVLIFATFLVALVRWQRLPELETVTQAARPARPATASQANGARPPASAPAIPTQPAPRSTQLGAPPRSGRRSTGKARSRRR